MRVVTWNVKGLPAPLRIGGPSAYRRIAELLTAESADILVMQEAFTTPAKAIAKAAGYRSIVFGAGSAFPRHLVDSGLALASLHALSEASRMSFGRSRCAGIDCLANKGALAARIQMPETPVDMFTLHLNWHRDAYEPPREPRREMFEQIAVLRQYVGDRRDVAIPAIIAGDFNFDRPDATLYAAWTDGWPITDVREARENDGRISLFDHHFILPGLAWHLRVVRALRRFAESGLSDHAAFVVDYDLVPTVDAPRSPSQPWH